ncbi:sensor histidine kinase [Dictyobacter aurantiacus]|uniref:histidine kinase n=1 Tax=Dictyobacter aurantiacus TaxID=1936993 RepID=A0A401ZP21_9CHLR|nr:GAF domain-containing sensor histidine kinase [Dictyobacter aurantiacus]GCE08627.1 hypothetical protein KDAU_59560 [Dictyobacter aurantiacus]
MEQFQKKVLSEVERFDALSRVSVALMSEKNESRLLHLIAQTATDLTGAAYAAFTLRPVNEQGVALVPSEGNLFYLAAVIGVSKEQEEFFRKIHLGGEGLLAPIFRYGVPVRVGDAMKMASAHTDRPTYSHEEAREAALRFAHGNMPVDELRQVGVPSMHPVICSFLGVPLLDSNNEVRGGLLLGHPEPDRFSADDERLLQGLAAQAAVALENARLYQAMQMRAREMDALFQSIADGVILLDQQGNIIRENERARDLRQQLLQLPDGKRIMEQMLYQPAATVLSRQVKEQTTVTMIDGFHEQHDYVINAAPLSLSELYKNSAPLGDANHGAKQDAHSEAVVVWHDATEAQRLLRERQVHADTEARRSLLQMILDELPTSVYLVRGKDARLVMSNYASRTVFGAEWKPGQSMLEFLGEHQIRIFMNDGRILPNEQLATLRAVQKGETVYQHQEVIRHADGTTLPVLVNAIALPPNKFRVPSLVASGVQEPELSAIVVHQDVTALKEAEYLKDEFIGIAAHELRTPLAVLHGCAQTLIVQTARGNGSTLADWQMESIQDIDQATRRLVELTEDLLDVSRLHAGHLELQIEAIDMVALARRVIKRTQLTTEQHQLKATYGAEYLVVNADSRRLEQVLTNVLNNAIKYSPAGGAIEITLAKSPDQQHCLLAVKDLGIGIPVQQQARIFGRFMRADNVRGISGTGLGLYLCRELVERHNGRIWFESIENVGTTFYISLPLVDDIHMA